MRLNLRRGECWQADRLESSSFAFCGNPCSRGADAPIAVHGCGISGDTAGKLFSPFFTTKSDGMGMGLNICRSIIELHKGRLWFETNPGGGTMFHFTLPLAHAHAT